MREQLRYDGFGRSELESRETLEPYSNLRYVEENKGGRKIIIYEGLSGVGTAIFSLGECLDNKYLSAFGAGLAAVGGLGILGEGFNGDGRLYKTKEKLSKLKDYLSDKLVHHKKRNGGINMKLDYYDNALL
ncbi:MAG: hypothetical protein J7K87_03065 [Candidatus Aenigmarchaeota archaeon]|nr:hypothetical protein [Candidatus Aenigmarchaeota archaeon]